MTDTTVGGVTYQVTPEYLADAATSCGSTASEVQTQLSQLRTFVTGLEDVWRGIAHDQFTTLMAEFDTYSAMLHDALIDIGNGLEGNYVNYVNSEVQNIKNLNALGEDIPIPSSNLS